MDLSIPKPAELAPSEHFAIVFDHYDPEDERRRESLLSLGNGVLHCRASAPEEPKGPSHYPGLYRAGCYARLSGQVEGQAVSTDSLANLPSWLALSFRHEGDADWLSLGRMDILDYRQRLDLRRAVLTREVRFRDLQGRTSRLCEERFMSMSAPHLGALRLRLASEDWSGRIEVRSGIDAGVRNELAVTEGGYDPQALEGLSLRADEETGCLVAHARTRGTAVEVAVAARTRVTGGHPGQASTSRVERSEATIAHHWHLEVAAGQGIEVEKVGVVYTSRDRAIASPAQAALIDAREALGYDALLEEHERAWAHLWGRCRLECDDENLSRAASLHAFHLLQTASPHAAVAEAGLPSRGWQEAYHGQIFWDETLSLPFLSLHLPDVARSVLIHRHQRLGAARRRAAEFGLDGALFPWRSGTVGWEETPEFQENPKSGRWHRDDTHFQFHVGSAIAHNTWRYFLATHDIDFMAGYGAEMMIEIARMWASLAKPHPGREGRFTIRGVVGPDEFHTRYREADKPGLDDDTYTNVMAAWTLMRAAHVLDRLPGHHREAVVSRLKLGPDEPGRWIRIAGRLHLPSGADGLFLPFDRYEDLDDFDLEAHERDHPGERLDWFVEAEGKDINALKVQKQATFAMLVHLLSLRELTETLDAMDAPSDADTIRRTIEADLARTSHDSSLSDLVYAGALARLSPKRSWTIFRDALHPDEKAGHSGTEKGVHLGAMAATLDILQRIHLGIRPAEDALVIDPAPPPHLGRMRLHILFRSQSLIVELDGDDLRLQADAANREGMPILALGAARKLQPGEELRAKVARRPEGEAGADRRRSPPRRQPDALSGERLSTG